MLRALCSISIAMGSACVRLSADHCANQDDPVAYCGAVHGRTFCSACIADADGCREDRPSTACDAADSASVADTGTATTTVDATSASGGMTSSDPSDPDSSDPSDSSVDSSTGGPPEPGCGNGIVEESIFENCDGDAMPLTMCSDVGLTGGMLGCHPPDGPLACKYDLGECNDTSQCGNGEIEGTENCDGTNLGDQTCESLDDGFIGGTLTCTPPPDGCQFNTTGCERCRDSGEDCMNTAQCCGNAVCGPVTRTCGLL